MILVCYFMTLIFASYVTLTHEDISGRGEKSTRIMECSGTGNCRIRIRAPAQLYNYLAAFRLQSL